MKNRVIVVAMAALLMLAVATGAFARGEQPGQECASRSTHPFTRSLRSSGSTDQALVVLGRGPYRFARLLPALPGPRPPGCGAAQDARASGYTGPCNVLPRPDTDCPLLEHGSAARSLCVPVPPLPASAAAASGRAGRRSQACQAVSIPGSRAPHGTTHPRFDLTAQA